MSNGTHEFEPGLRLTRDVLNPLKKAFVGKDEIVDLLGVSLAAGENLFVLGPPGTAKSALVRELGRRVEGRTFEYLLTRFTEPNELFGPFDIRKLREGELVTNTEGMLPEASILFLDELLNANSAILNGLLGVLNERVFRRGKEVRTLPLLMTVGASNRLPEDETLGALFDRFLLRVRCDSVPDERLVEVLGAGWALDTRERQGGANLKEASGFTVEDIRALQTRIAQVDMNGVRGKLSELVLRLRRAGIQVSDRRAVKLQRLAAASALICGRSTALVSDLWIFRHIWDTEEQQETLAALVDDFIRAEPQSPQAHPRALGQTQPNSELLAKELEDIEARLAKPELNAPERAALQDRLGILAGRCAWIKEETSRQFIQQKCDALWKRLTPAG